MVNVSQDLNRWNTGLDLRNALCQWLRRWDGWGVGGIENDFNLRRKLERDRVIAMFCRVYLHRTSVNK
jgi:hypothetical protein